MPQVFIHFAGATLRAIDRFAPAAKRKRADFIRRAVKDEIFRFGGRRPHLGSPRGMEGRLI